MAGSPGYNGISSAVIFAPELRAAEFKNENEAPGEGTASILKLRLRDSLEMSCKPEIKSTA